MKIKGKRVLITGSAKRCGAELAKAFASAGAQVVVHYCTSRVEAESLLVALPGEGHTLWAADFSRPDELEKQLSGLGKIDILINNASLFYRPGSPEDLAADEVYRQVNFLAPARLLDFWVLQAPAGGCAVNILDQAVLSPGEGGYWKSRKELMELTLSMAKRYGSGDLRVNAVAPGPLLPPYWAPDSRMEKTLPTLPLRRPVAVDDFAGAVLFLCENESITGAVLPVDCGQHLNNI